MSGWKFNLLGFVVCVRAPRNNLFSFSLENHFRIIGYRILHSHRAFPTRDSEPYEFYINAKWTNGDGGGREKRHRTTNNTYRVRHIRTSIFANISNFNTTCMDCPKTETIEFCIILFFSFIFSLSLSVSVCAVFLLLLLLLLLLCVFSL